MARRPPAAGTTAYPRPRSIAGRGGDPSIAFYDAGVSPAPKIRLRAARPDDAAELSALALRSKAYWGYDEPFLARAAEALTIVASEVRVRRTVLAELAGRPVGFSTLDGDPPGGELGNLWVDPAAIGTGVGRLLWTDVLARAAAAGYTSLTIDADPHAEGFYLRMGAVRVGETPSASIPGRMLPLLRITLDGSAA